MSGTQTGPAGDGTGRLTTGLATGGGLLCSPKSLLRLRSCVRGRKDFGLGNSTGGLCVSVSGVALPASSLMFCSPSLASDACMEAFGVRLCIHKCCSNIGHTSLAGEDAYALQQVRAACKSSQQHKQACGFSAQRRLDSALYSKLYFASAVTEQSRKGATQL